MPARGKGSSKNQKNKGAKQASQQLTPSAEKAPSGTKRRRVSKPKSVGKSNSSRVRATSDKRKAQELFRLVEKYSQTASDYEDQAVDACILFADLVGSTAYKQHRDNPIEGMVKTLRHNQIAARVVQKGEGAVVKFLGDGLLAVFRGDGAGTAAIRTGLAIIAEIEEENAKLRLTGEDAIETRIGVHQGGVWLFPRDLSVADGDVSGTLDPYGLTVDVAARLCDLAGQQQMICSAAVLEQAEAMDPTFLSKICVSRKHRRFLKGVKDLVELYEVRAHQECEGVRLQSHDRHADERTLEQLENANSLLQRRHFADALVAFNLIHDRDPGNYDANYRIAELLINVNFAPNIIKKINDKLPYDLDDAKERLQTAFNHLCWAKEVRPDSCRAWLLFSWLLYKLFELNGDADGLAQDLQKYAKELGIAAEEFAFECSTEADLLTEAMNRAKHASEIASRSMDVEGMIIAKTYLAMFLVRRAQINPENSQEDLERAESYCLDIEEQYDKFSERHRSDYLVTHALVMIERGQAQSRTDEIKKMIATAKAIAPTNSKASEVEARLVDALNEGNDSGQPIAL